MTAIAACTENNKKLTSKSYMIPGTKPDASPAGFPPPNHFLVAEKMERWRPFLETICSTQNQKQVAE